MQRVIVRWCTVLSVAVVFGAVVMAQRPAAGSKAEQVPTFRYDPTWPKQLPNNWVIGQVGALFVDAKDHIWIAQRPGGTTNLSERYGLLGYSECCFPAPPVIEFDQAGNMVQAWGAIHENKGELVGPQVSGPYPAGAWPTSEHGIFVEPTGTVWVDSSTAPSSLLKLKRDGKLLMQIGKQQAKTSSDTVNLGGPTSMVVDAAAREVFVADGYENRRVVVFDSETGAYKRHWGAYGKRPDDSAVPAKYDPAVRSPQFGEVRGIALSRDGLVYVCDRTNNRIQVFRRDGTFVKEGLVSPKTLGGAVYEVAFSPDPAQTYAYVVDGMNEKVWILLRDSLETIGSFGYGGNGGGAFRAAHSIATDSKGNLYVGETWESKRVQRFLYKGLAPAKR